MKKIFFLIILISTICFGQTKYDKHDELISKANYYRGIEDFGQAIVKYQEALQILTPNSSTPFFNLAYCSLQFKNTTLADEWIRKGVSQGGAQMEYLRKYKGFQNIQDMEFYKAIISDYNVLRQKYFSTIDDIDLYLKIEELTSRDQFVRKTGMFLDGYSEVDFQSSGEVFSKAQREGDSIKRKEAKKILFHKTQDKYTKITSELMQRVDSLNIARLMEITEEHGWQERAWIILWHQRGTYGENNYIWNFFKPIINQEIEDGKLSRKFWNPFDIFEEMNQQMKNGSFNPQTFGTKPKKEIKMEKEKIKG